MEPLPRTPQELGVALRRLRGSLGYRALAARQAPFGIVVSKTSLARYEAGQRPPLGLAEHLSELYGGQGWVEIAIRGLWVSDWNPWATESSDHVHVVSWPAAYSGVVWVFVRPNPLAVSREHRIHLQWGHWDCELDIVLPAHGAVFTTGKSVDAMESVGCMVTADRPIYLLHGAGTNNLPADCLDISRMWARPASE